MKNKIYILLLSLCIGCSNLSMAQENELICSQRYDFCFQIPANFFMLTTNDIESSTVSYKTVDASSTIEITNGDLSSNQDFHKLFQFYLGQWADKKSRVTLKKEYNDYFIISGYTSQGRGFYQKVIKIDNDFASAYLEFPKGNKRFSNISQMLFDHFEKTILN